ncbi:MAG: hypothetical protein R6T91_00515 [Bacteroidales bacterium]
MNRAITLIVFLNFYGFLLVGQNSSEQQKKIPMSPHEIQLGVANLLGDFVTNQESSLSNVRSIQGGSISAYDEPSMALGYRYHIDNSAIRAGFNMAFYKGETEDMDPQKSEKYSLGSFYLGYQYEFLFPRTSLFTGMDVFIEQQKYEYISDQLPTFYEKRTSDNQGYGVRPFLGVRFFVNKHISLSTTSFYYIRSYTLKYEKVDQDGVEMDKETVNGSTMKFGPLGTIAINFHF